jgi:ornithine cyclodeaminase/alanine dehydrogenase-like protein (mu-crystallin family)
VRILILNQSEVRGLLPMAECMPVMSDALGALARGEAILPLRPIMWLPDRSGALALMPSALLSTRASAVPDVGAMGVKIISVFPGNHGTAYDSHQGAVLLFDTAHGRLLAMMDATEITAIRTAAVSGVATRLLARPDAATLAILGSGVQARTHLEAMLEARAIADVRIWSRSRAHAATFAEREARRFGLPISAAASIEAAVAGADIICTTTASREPLLRGEWIAPGTHINAVGASIPSARELDTAAVVRSRLYVDRRESTLHEAGDFLIPRAEGAITDAHIVAELGEVIVGTAAGRGAREEITLFKSLGLAIEDLAAAQHIYQRAVATGAGTSVELGGEREG